MAQRKSHEVDGWLSRPDAHSRIVLLYGPDKGLVSERATRLAAQSGVSLDDPFSVVRFDASELEQDPGKLLDEARMVPMFGGERLIWIRNAGAHKGFADAVGELLKTPPADARIVIEAGDLKKGAGLRGSVEAADAGMALPCYADEERTVDALLDQELERAGLSIDQDARRLLRSRLGGDRLATRGEIEKLVLYCAGQGRIALADVEASSGDVASASIDQAIDAALTGALANMDNALLRVTEAGAHAQAILGAMMRQFQQIEAIRRNVEIANVQVGAAVGGARPPVFFARRRVVEQAVSSWNLAGIARALSRLQEAILGTRRRPELSAAIVRQTMLAIAVESARQRRGRR